MHLRPVLRHGLQLAHGHQARRAGHVDGQRPAPLHPQPGERLLPQQVRGRAGQAHRPLGHRRHQRHRPPAHRDELAPGAVGRGHRGQNQQPARTGKPPHRRRGALLRAQLGRNEPHRAGRPAHQPGTRLRRGHRHRAAQRPRLVHAPGAHRAGHHRRPRPLRAHPLILGRKDGAMAVSNEPCGFPNLGYEIDYNLGPGEVVRLTADGFEQLRRPGCRRQVCSFLWVYYGYPVSGIRRHQRRRGALPRRRGHGPRRHPQGRGLRGRHPRLGRGARAGLRRGHGRALQARLHQIHPHLAPQPSPPPGRRCASSSPR